MSGQYFDMNAYFGRGSNWLQPRPLDLANSGDTILNYVKKGVRVIFLLATGERRLSVLGFRFAEQRFEIRERKLGG